MSSDDAIPPGTVWLVGAGPGDPELLTRKAERLIRAASIVFIDALVGPGVVDLIPHDVRRVYVGKRSGRHSKDQRTINELLLEAALAGERVVRLKGGDPTIFGRATEEMDALAAHGVPVRICPGVTAASAAAASAGISLTSRGLARRLTFVTAHARAGEAIALDWATLADPDATLAIYMGKAAAVEVAAKLIAGGLPPATPALVIENASLPEERVFRTRLDLLPLAAATATSCGPALLLVGDAVGRIPGCDQPANKGSEASCSERQGDARPHAEGAGGPRFTAALAAHGRASKILRPAISTTTIDVPPNVRRGP